MNKIPTYLIIEKKKKREDQTPVLERCIFHASVTCNVALNQYRDPFGEIPPPFNRDSACIFVRWSDLLLHLHSRIENTNRKKASRFGFDIDLFIPCYAIAKARAITR